jgi:hypothetical protein
MTDFGHDLSCREDLDPTMREVAGVELLAEAGHRRLRTRRGQLLDEETYGLDVVDWLHAESTPDELAQMPGTASAELLKDERFQAVAGTISTTQDGGVSLDLACETATGPFTLTMDLGSLIASGAL